MLVKARLSALNLLETIGKALNFKKKFNNWLLNYIRENYDPKLDYTSTLYKRWRRECFDAFTDILFNGIVGWLFAISLLNFIPSLGNFLRVGPGVFHLLSIFSIGISLWFIKGTYKWFRKDYKGGMK